MENDLPALWDHAQRGLVVALLRKAYRDNPTVQDHILLHFQHYVDGLQNRASRRWREGNLQGPGEDFLTQCPPFALPSRGELKKLRGPSRLAQASGDYMNVLACFKRSLKKVYRNPTVRKQDLKKALAEVFGTTSWVPEEKWAEWAPEVRSPKQPHQIALEATALKYGLQVSSLKRHGVPLANRAKMEAGLKEGDGTGQPGRAAIEQKVRALQALLVRSRR